VLLANLDQVRGTTTGFGQKTHFWTKK